MTTNVKFGEKELSGFEKYQKNWKTLKRDSLSVIKAYDERLKEEMTLLKRQVKDHKKYQLYTHSIDSLHESLKSVEQQHDSLMYVKRNIDWKEVYERTKNEIDHQLSDNRIYQELSEYEARYADQLSVDTVLHKSLTKIEERAGNEFENYASTEFGNEPDIQKLSGETEALELARQAQELMISDKEKMQRAFSKVSQLSAREMFVANEEKVVEAIQVLDTAKLKDKQLGTFENPKASRSWSEHFSYGGNLQIEISETTLIDFLPWIGWNIRKQWIWGVGANYKAAWTFGDGLEYIPEQEHIGARVFTEYDFWKGIYLHGEAERLWQTFNLSEAEEPNTTQGANGWLLGLGKTYQIKGKLQGNFQVLYNFGYDEQGPYHKPWIIRFGLRHN
ncbi:MAG: hypothetical protein RIF33_10220 [Cyclobacteriaceae bacterium]